MAEPNTDELTRLCPMIEDLASQQKPVKDERDILMHDLKEWEMALKCLSGLLKIIKNSDYTVEEAIAQILDLIPLAWQHPDETAARITVDGIEYKTSNFTIETQWRHQAEIITGEERRGVFEVFYIESKPESSKGTFLWEKQELLEAFAAGIAGVVEFRQMSGKLEEQTQIIQKISELEKEHATKLARIISKLKSNMEKAEQSLLGVNKSLAGLSCEIRNPLSEIIAASDKYLPEIPDVSRTEFPEIIRTACGRISRVIDRLQDYSQISSGKFVQKNTEFSLRHEVQSAVESIYGNARAKGIELIPFINPIIPDCVVGDVKRLQLIIQNLIEGAMERTPHGEIVISVELEVSSHMQPIFHFTVSDPAPAISAENQPAFFEPFAHYQESSPPGNLCSSLGMAIARHLVELMGGEIWLEVMSTKNSEEARGNVTHFTMWLDVKKEASSESAAERLDGAEHQKVLILDDSSTYRTLYSQLFTHWGLGTVATGNCNHMMDTLGKLIAKGRPPLSVIIDLNIPEMKRLGIIERISGDGWMDKTTVILTGAAPRAEDESRAKELGVSAILPKPLRQSELYDLVKSGVANLASRPAPEAKEEKVERPADTVEEEKPEKEMVERKVLLAGNDDPNRSLAEKLLAKRGHQVTKFNDLQQLMEMVVTGEYDMAFIDITEAFEEELEALRSLRSVEQATGKRIPIIALTAESVEISPEKMKEIGLDDCLTAPINPKRLLECIGKYTEVGDEKEVVSEDPVSEPLPDFDPKAALENMDGDAYTLMEFIDIFDEEHHCYLDRIDRAIASEDGTELAKTAHSLKLTCGDIGAPAVQEVADQIESIACENNWDSARPLVEALKAAIKRFRTEASAYEEMSLRT